MNTPDKGDTSLEMTFDEKRDKLAKLFPEAMNKIIWSTQFVFEDMLYSMSEYQEGLLDRLLAMNEDEFNTWLCRHHRTMHKYMESGIMHDWDYVARTAMQEVVWDMAEKDVQKEGEQDADSK